MVWFLVVAFILALAGYWMGLVNFLIVGTLAVAASIGLAYAVLTYGPQDVFFVFLCVLGIVGIAVVTCVSSEMRGGSVEKLLGLKKDKD